MKADRHIAYYMLVEAFAAPGCPICRIVEASLLRYLDLLIHENVNDVNFRAELREAGGFCVDHGWWLVDRVRGGALGTSIMYRDVLHALAERLVGAGAGRGILPPGRRRGGSAWRVGRAAPGCPLCIVRRREEDAFVGTFAEHCEARGFVESYESSAGLCFGHLDRVLLAMRDPEGGRLLIAAHRQIIGRMLGELDEFQRKNDYRFSSEPMYEEADSWQRAVELVNGRPGVA
jgi:hypothetical protein